MSGAYKNAGDFLINHRCRQLIHSVIPDAEICEFKNNQLLDDSIHEINRNDIIILGGGPGYVRNLYPNILSLTTRLSDIKIPIFPMALGWIGSDVNSDTLYQFKFGEGTRNLFSKISWGERLSFGCRDIYSEKILRINGIRNTIMTGCAAWYDSDYIDSLKIHNDGEIKRICISDPADPFLHDMLFELCVFLKEYIPDVSIRVVFHRGITPDQYTSDETGSKLQKICNKLDQIGVVYSDISYSWNGFELYDKCDIHIGFRVHAHIYNLSHRNRTILIEEDSRGAGVNDTLGLQGIKAHDIKKNFNNSIIRKVNNHMHFRSDKSQYICCEVMRQLESILSDKGIQYTWAFDRMRYYYEKMIKHISQINKIL